MPGDTRFSPQHPVLPTEGEVFWGGAVISSRTKNTKKLNHLYRPRKPSEGIIPSDHGDLVALAVNWAETLRPFSVLWARHFSLGLVVFLIQWLIFSLDQAEVSYAESNVVCVRTIARFGDSPPGGFAGARRSARSSGRGDAPGACSAARGKAGASFFG